VKERGRRNLVFGDGFCWAGEGAPAMVKEALFGQVIAGEILLLLQDGPVSAGGDLRLLIQSRNLIGMV
jgi:hypothetical protein